MTPGSADDSTDDGPLDRYRVREARADDLPALRAIQATTLAEPWRELLELAVDGPAILLVVDAPDDAVGDVPAPAGYALAVADGNEGYLAELAVREPYRGDGRGAALLTALVDRLRERGVDRVRVTVREVDERARAFYRDRGFERRERLSDHYERGDGFLLEREIQ